MSREIVPAEHVDALQNEMIKGAEFLLAALSSAREPGASAIAQHSLLQLSAGMFEELGRAKLEELAQLKAEVDAQLKALEEKR